jgi:S1-C subfamily serine protease
MKRREFMSLLGVTAWPPAAGAQQRRSQSHHRLGLWKINMSRNDTDAIAAQQDGPPTPPPCGWIGAQVRPITASFAASLGMAVPYGAIFEQPEAGSPAAKAGIAAGDVITAIDGAPLMRASDFITIFANKAPGTLVSLSTWRSGMFIRVTLTLGSSECRDERQDARTGSA